MGRIGIMQGRLLPPVDERIQCFPRDHWASEFALAAAAGLECIEWIYDEYGADVNPLWTDDGLAQLHGLVEQSGVKVSSVCADYFMDRPLVRATAAEMADRIGSLERLMDRCRAVGGDRIVLPFVDASQITSADEMASVVRLLQRALIAAERTGIEIHLETSLGPADFAELLERLPHPLLKANYDTGNSASLGYDPREEFAAYGARVGSVHVKDRLRGGGTVPFGQGDADIGAVFAGLRAADYTGDLILQVARGVPGDEVGWAAENRSFVVQQMTSADLNGIGAMA